MPPAAYIAACVLLGIRAVSSLPTTDTVYPEVIPGPGLPSLAELGLTSAQLYTMKPDYNISAVSRAIEFTGICGPDPGYVQVASVVACYNFLNALGSYKSTVQRLALPLKIAYSEGAAIYAQGLEATSTTASDAAGGVLWVLNSCSRPDGSIAGSQAATGMATSLLKNIMRTTFKVKKWYIKD